MVIIYLYFIELLIRPQDWYPLMLEWPTHWMIVIPGFVLAMLTSTNKSSILKAPESKLLIAYTLYILVSTYVNEGYWEARIQFTKGLKVASIFYLVYLLLDEEKKIKRSMIFLLLLGVLLGEHAVEQALTGTGWAGVTLDQKYADIRTRWTGIWDGSNGFALLFGVILPIGIEYFMGDRRKLVRLPALFSILMISTGIFLCNSRGSTVAVLCGLAFYAISRFSKKQVAVVLVLCLALAGALMPSRMQNVDTGEESVRQRMWAWEQGLKMFKQNPLVGVGKGQFAKNNQELIQAHNNYVQVLSETGIVGFFLFVGFLWFPIRRGITIQWKIGWAQYKDLLIVRALNTSCLVFLGGTFFIVVEHDLITCLFGLASAATWNELKKSDSEFSKVDKWDLIGILSCMAVIYAAVWFLVVADVL